MYIDVAFILQLIVGNLNILLFFWVSYREKPYNPTTFDNFFFPISFVISIVIVTPVLFLCEHLNLSAFEFWLYGEIAFLLSCFIIYCINISYPPDI